MTVWNLDDSKVEMLGDRTTVTTGNMVTTFSDSRSAAEQIAALHTVVQRLRKTSTGQERAELNYYRELKRTGGVSTD